MRTGIPRIIALAALPLLTAGCATTGAVDTDPLSAFAPVSDRTASVTGKQTVWLQSAEEARKVGERVQALVRNRTVGPDTAVQVALLNNKGLQAAYADVGLSQAEVWQQSLLVNPTVSVGLTGVDPVRSIEATVANNILAVITRPKRMAIADTRLRQAQLRAAEETLRVAADTRRAWIDAVSAWERVAYLNQAQAAADAASELAQKLGETGAFTKSGQAREHVFYAELAGQTAEARMQARMAKEALTRLMGLWGSDLDYQVPNALPSLPKRPTAKRAIEAEALRNRVDLEVARLELEALARAYGLTSATRYLTDLDIVSGAEVEREKEDDGTTTTTTTPRIELDFVIPIFDSGQARLRKAELAYMRAANLLAEKAVNVRSEARGAYDGYRSSYDIARHYRNNVVPLRTTIEEEAVLTYNGMITNTFELLADTRARIGAIMLSLNAKRQFWLADVNLGTAIHGGGPGSSPAVATEVAAAGDGGGGH
ncbi:TolC family protein [Nitratireductor sp. StC3]|uniref:TolC family protein n=1 Tax=Nitratireductor sp. StC3 TaxID=2126741 RepID=UPI000D0D7C69|nr:TolC family protein [Nitratireductor sp. StC3]PSM19856.1 copper resistance protein [Nitratireductor sp. StC3]